jgi:hypothetical protein
MDWNDLLSRRYAARWIFGLIAIVLVLLFATRFAVLPRIWPPREPLGPFDSTWANAALEGIDAAVSTLLTVGLTGAFLFLLVPKDVRDGRVVTVHPKDIDAELKATVPESREYFFRGRSARYFRSTILPLIEAGSRGTSATRVVWLLMPDPRDEPLMESYARYRNAAAFRGRAADWTAWDIQKEIVAAVVAFAAKSRSNPHLEFHIGLSRSFSILRVNMTDATAVLTRDDPKLPAFKAARGTVFYDSYREDIRLSIRQAGEVDLAVLWPDDVVVDAMSAATAVAALGFASAAADPAKVTEVVEAVNKVSNPYA